MLEDRPARRAARVAPPTRPRRSTRPSQTVSTRSTTRSRARRPRSRTRSEVSFLFAAAAGVYVSASAGNSGPAVSTVAHPSPWITTTAAERTTVTVRARSRSTAPSTTVPRRPRRPPYGQLARLTCRGRQEAVTAGLRTHRMPGLCASSAHSTRRLAAGKIVVCDRGVNARTDKSLEVVKRPVESGWCS